MEEVRQFEQAINRNKQLAGFISYYFDGCYNLAALNALLGNKNEALKWLDKAIDKGFIDLEIINNDPDIDTLRTEPKFKELLSFVEEKKDKIFKDPPFTAIEGPQTDGKTKLPLIVLLHGEAENANAILDIWRGVAKENNLVVVSPQGQYIIGEGHYQWGKRLEAQEAALKAIDMAKQKYTIDQNKIYIMGFSQGASYALTIGLSNPEIFAGVIALSPRYLYRVIEKSLEKPKTRQMSVFLANGENEDPHLLANNRFAKESLSKVGIKADLKLYRNTGHAFPPNFAEEMKKAYLWVEKK
jgi:phospholipase/carboxylesterase